MTEPHGEFTTSSYGSFGSVERRLQPCIWQQELGELHRVEWTEYRAVPDAGIPGDACEGNEENLFDRFDYQFSRRQCPAPEYQLHAVMVQNPNSYDNLNIGVVGPDGNLVGPTDQRAQIKTFNVAPSWTKTLSANAIFTFGGYVRQDQFNYYPSNNPFADLSPIATGEYRAGPHSHKCRAAFEHQTYAKGIHNIKAGASLRADLPNRE